MDNFGTIIIQLLLALTIALTIERLMEVVKAIYDLLDSRFNLYIYWTKKTIKIKNKLESKIRSKKIITSSMLLKIFKKIDKLLLDGNKVHSGNRENPVLCGDMVRAFYLQIFLKIISIIAGIGAAYLLSIDFISMWRTVSNNDHVIYKPTAIGIVFSGMCIGYGTGPVHYFISKIERKKKLREMDREDKFYDYIS